MKSADHFTLRLSAKALIPIATLIAATMIANGGSGLAGGALLALTVTLHALVFGAAAAQRAFPAAIWRVAGALALAAMSAAVCAPDWSAAALLQEAALAAAIVTSFGLAFTMLMARAPSLRDEEW